MLKRMFVAGAIAGTVAGCGGGGSGAGSSSGDRSATLPRLALSGTATNGVAIASAPISAKCQGATGTTTTNADGTYSVSISGAALPCMLELSNPSDNTKLHSIAIGTGNSATSNITPLTELVVANLTRQTPATAFSGFDAEAAAKSMTADASKASQTSVVSFLTANKVDVTALANTDLVSSSLVAATAANPTDGDARNGVLAAVQKTITAPLSEVASILATSPAACPVARSGKYTVVSYTGAVSSYDIDFSASTILLPGAVKPTAFTASGTRQCEFSAGDVTVNFASSGMAIYKATSAAEIGIAFPAQAFNKAVFGDIYNVTGYFAGGGGFAAPDDGNAPNAQAGTMKINADGSFRLCGESDYSDQCTLLGNALSGNFSATPNADGTDNIVFPDGSTGRFYSYTAPNGNKLLVMGDTHSLVIAAKQAPIDSSKIALNSTSVFYYVKGYSGFGSGAALNSGTNTVTAVSATEITQLQHLDDGVTPDETQVALLNNPWNGMRHRNADATKNIGARTGMSTALGFSTNGSVNKIANGVITAPGTAQFSLSVSK
jgi:hypothetical protein